MTKTLRKSLAILLAAMLLLSGLNLSVLAEETEGTAESTAQSEVESAPAQSEPETTETTEPDETNESETAESEATETPAESTTEAPAEPTEVAETAPETTETAPADGNAIAPASLGDAQTPAAVNDAAKTIYVDANAVSDGDGTENSPYKSLDAALENAKSGDTIHLGEGTYCGNTASPTNAGNGAGKSLTFVGKGADKTTWQIRALDNPTSTSDGHCDYSFQGSDSITFENMTVVGSVYPDGTTIHAYDMQGLVRINNITLKDCTFNGRADYWGYETTTFENVIFNAPGTEASGITGTNYSLWTYTGSTYTFENCTFNSTGKTINVYRHNASQFTSDVTINYESCTVNNTAHKKQAMKINDSTAGEHKFIINISGNNTVKGIEPNAITCSRLFGFDSDSENAGHTKVTINGTTVWEKGVRVGEHNNTTLVADGDNSYTNGVEGSDASVLYTDGYKDNAFTTTYGSWTAGNDGKLHREGKKTCSYCGYSEDVTEEKDFELNVSRSKTATALDSSKQSTVTLSLPSASEKLASDVVFVLDASDCVDEVMDKISGLVEQLETAQKNTGANIKVGVVAFKGSALPLFDGKMVSVNEAKTTLAEIAEKVRKAATVDEKEDVVLDYLKGVDNEFIYKGSNLHSGLIAAQTMLDSDDTVASGRKYVVTVTDGLTYYWNDDDGNVYGVYSKHSVDSHNLLFYAWCETNNVDSLKSYALPAGFDWTEYVTGARTKIAADGNEYRVNVREAATKLDTNYSGVRFPGKTEDALKTLGIPAVPAAENDKHALGVDYSVISCLDTYEEMVDAGYQCYTLNPNTKYGTDTFSGLFTSELNEMAGKTVVDFSSIQNEILYAVGAGSEVVDTMGEDFDFITGSLKLTVGGTELKTKTVDSTTYFGDDADALSESAYRFKVEYDSTGDKLTWTIGENVSNFAPVQLTYTVKLVNVQTAVGTYGQTDLDGNGVIDGTETDVESAKALYTNASAILTPVDSNGNRGKKVEFPMPSVSYDVTGSGSKGHSHHHEWKDDDDDDETVIVSPTTTTDSTGEIIIEDEDVPLGAAPDTGDAGSPKTLFAVMGVSALGLSAALCLGSKKKDDEDK